MRGSPSSLRLWLTAAVCFTVGCASPEVSRAIGARCDTERECDDVCLTGGDHPGGFCSLTCRNDGDCPSDARCATDRSACLLRCSTNDDCKFLGSKWGCHSQSGASGKICRGN
jgi:hypothetical protein